MTVFETAARQIYRSHGVKLVYVLTDGRTKSVLALRDFAHYPQIKKTAALITSAQRLFLVMKKPPDATKYVDVLSRRYFLNSATPNGEGEWQIALSPYKEVSTSNLQFPINHYG